MGHIARTREMRNTSV